MKCKKCGAEMKRDNKVLTSHPPKYSYTCPDCGNVEYVTVGGETVFGDDASKNNNDNNNFLQGWVCPKCGGVMSPFQNTCPYCAPPVKLEVWN